MRIALCTALLLAATAAQAKDTPKHKHKHSHKAHAHGIASADIAVDGNTVAVTIEVPGDVIFGFEHRPKTDAQKATVKSELKRLKDDGATLFILPAEAKCTATTTTVESSLEGTDSKKAESGHADVDAKYKFTCTGELKGKTMATGLFKAWPRLKKLKLQIVGGAGQQGLTLTADATDIKI